jgi:hypothetical protein
MDSSSFDQLTAGIARAQDRRGVLRLLGATTFGAASLLAVGTFEGEAKKRGGGKKKRKKGNKPGNTDSPNSSPTCTDGAKNGSETDVDCGGSCGRCNVGKTCTSRDDCTTAYCNSGTCAEWSNPTDCGLDSDGSNCATRINAQNQKICTKINGRFFANGTCADHCLASEQCVLPVSGGVECVLPCGAAE